MIATILETGQQARIDSYEGLPGAVAARLRSAGAQAAYGVPILVDDKVWGVMAAVLTDGVVADDAEQRLANFTELIATAVSNAQARDDLSRLVAEQASLRRVATLVARESAGEDLFSVVAGEVQQLFDVPDVAIVRFEQRDVVLVGTAGANPFIPDGSRWSLDGPSVCAAVLDSGRPARMDDYHGLRGTVAAMAQKWSFRSVAGAPVIGLVAGCGARSSSSPPSIHSPNAPSCTSLRTPNSSQPQSRTASYARRDYLAFREHGSSPPTTRRASALSAPSTTASSND